MRSSLMFALLAATALSAPANAMCGGQAVNANQPHTGMPMCGMMKMAAANVTTPPAAAGQKAAGGCCCARGAMNMGEQQTPGAPSEPEKMPEMPGMETPKTPAP